MCLAVSGLRLQHSIFTADCTGQYGFKTPICLVVPYWCTLPFTDVLLLHGDHGSATWQNCSSVKAKEEKKRQDYAFWYGSSKALG